MLTAARRVAGQSADDVMEEDAMLQVGVLVRLLAGRATLRRRRRPRPGLSTGDGPRSRAGRPTSTGSLGLGIAMRDVKQDELSHPPGTWPARRRFPRSQSGSTCQPVGRRLGRSRPCRRPETGSPTGEGDDHAIVGLAFAGDSLQFLANPLSRGQEVEGRSRPPTASSARHGRPRSRPAAGRPRGGDVGLRVAEAPQIVGVIGSSRPRAAHTSRLIRILRREAVEAIIKTSAANRPGECRNRIASLQSKGESDGIRRPPIRRFIKPRSATDRCQRIALGRPSFAPPRYDGSLRFRVVWVTRSVDVRRRSTADFTMPSDPRD